MTAKNVLGQTKAVCEWIVEAAAAREENIAILNKPVKPASLRALLGQWRAQQTVAAAE